MATAVPMPTTSERGWPLPNDSMLDGDAWKDSTVTDPAVDTTPAVPGRKLKSKGSAKFQKNNDGVEATFRTQDQQEAGWGGGSRTRSNYQGHENLDAIIEESETSRSGTPHGNRTDPAAKRMKKKSSEVSDMSAARAELQKIHDAAASRETGIHQPRAVKPEGWNRGHTFLDSPGNSNGSLGNSPRSKPGGQQKSNSSIISAYGNGFQDAPAAQYSNSSIYNDYANGLGNSPTATSGNGALAPNASASRPKTHNPQQQHGASAPRGMEDFSSWIQGGEPDTGTKKKKKKAHEVANPYANQGEGPWPDEPDTDRKRKMPPPIPESPLPQHRTGPDGKPINKNKHGVALDPDTPRRFQILPDGTDMANVTPKKLKEMWEKATPYDDVIAQEEAEQAKEKKRQQKAEEERRKQMEAKVKAAFNPPRGSQAPYMGGDPKQQQRQPRPPHDPNQSKRQRKEPRQGPIQTPQPPLPPPKVAESQVPADARQKPETNKGEQNSRAAPTVPPARHAQNLTASSPADLRPISMYSDTTEVYVASATSAPMTKGNIINATAPRTVPVSRSGKKPSSENVKTTATFIPGQDDDYFYPTNYQGNNELNRADTVHESKRPKKKSQTPLQDAPAAAPSNTGKGHERTASPSQPQAPVPTQAPRPTLSPNNNRQPPQGGDSNSAPQAPVPTQAPRSAQGGDNNSAPRAPVPTETARQTASRAPVASNGTPLRKPVQGPDGANRPNTLSAISTAAASNVAPPTSTATPVTRPATTQPTQPSENDRRPRPSRGNDGGGAHGSTTTTARTPQAPSAATPPGSVRSGTPVGNQPLNTAIPDVFDGTPTAPRSRTKLGTVTNSAEPESQGKKKKAGMGLGSALKAVRNFDMPGGKKSKRNAATAGTSNPLSYLGNGGTQIHLVPERNDSEPMGTTANAWHSPRASRIPNTGPTPQQRVQTTATKKDKKDGFGRKFLQGFGGRRPAAPSRSRDGAEYAAPPTFDSADTRRMDQRLYNMGIVDRRTGAQPQPPPPQPPAAKKKGMLRAVPTPMKDMKKYMKGVTTGGGGKKNKAAAPKSYQGPPQRGVVYR